MIIITGATGHLGGAVVENLLGRVPAERIGVSVRDPGKARSLADRGVRVRRGNYDDPASLAEAFEGADQVLVVSASTHGEAARRQHRAAVEAAVATLVDTYVASTCSATDSSSPSLSPNNR